ncbi:MAG TPA: 16S rRNA (guanine(966)-N(2))-methyltransferase RsmD [Burkholderiaceae bacterium]|nr:16S rRNA (guanine(966)-N(2))-methyltransferase RsmD [Burkholderiaceae bacterium]
MKPARVRIIGGRWKRTPLPVPDIEGLRPTPDRVRETLFNWLGQDLTGLHCLDLFAGSGALGLEAASRGAARVLMVEQDPRAAAGIRQAIARLAAREVTLVQADAMTALATCQRRDERFDLVFLDPPFHQGWVERVLPPVLALLRPDAQVYIEHESALTAVSLPSLPAGSSTASRPSDSATGSPAASSPASATAPPLRLQDHRAGKAGQVHYHLFTTTAALTEDPA